MSLETRKEQIKKIKNLRFQIETDSLPQVFLKKSLRILVLVISSPGTHYEVYRNTWAAYLRSDPRVNGYFLELVEAQKEGILISEETQTIQVRGKESYIPGILYKTIRSFQHFDEKYDYVVRTNLSSLIHFDRLVDYLQEHAKPTLYYAGGLGTHWEPSMGRVFPYCSGDLFILSQDLVHYVGTHLHSYEPFPDDLQIGQCIEDAWGDLRNPLPRQIWKKEEICTSDPHCFHYRFRTYSSRLQDRLEDAYMHRFYAQQLYPSCFPEASILAYEILSDQYRWAQTIPSEVHEHLDLLRMYAEKSLSVVEWLRGNSMASSWGFLKGLSEGIRKGVLPKRSMICGRPSFPSTLLLLRPLAETLGIEFHSIEASSPPRDLSKLKFRDEKEVFPKILSDLPLADLYFIDFLKEEGFEGNLDIFYTKAQKYILIPSTGIEQLPTVPPEWCVHKILSQITVLKRGKS